MTATDWLQYREGLLFLLIAGVVAPLFRSMRLSPVLGFLLAGALVGPFGLGSLAGAGWRFAGVVSLDPARMSGLADFGVVFLMFMIGLELSFERVARMKRLVFGLGALQVASAALVLAGLAVAVGQSLTAAAVIGAALSLSSTAIVVPTLAERRRLGSAAGRTVFCVLLFQDLMAAPFLFAVSALSHAARGGLLTNLAWSIGAACAAVALLVLVGRTVLRPLFHLVAGAHSTEFFVAACLLVIVAAGLSAAAAGLSMSLGAFVAGLLLAETEFRREVEVTIEPFKGLLLGLFFVSVGANLDLGRLTENPLRIIGLTAGLIAIKTGLAALSAAPFKLARPVGVQIALLLGPGGEFAFVMLAAAGAAGAIDTTVAADLSIAVCLGMAFIPALASIALRLAPARHEPLHEALAEGPPDELTGHVLIIGYGRVGRLVAEMMTRHSLRFIAVDRDPAVVAAARSSGAPIYFGDATRPEFLRRCGIEAAKGVIVTMDGARAVEDTVSAARRIRSDLTLVARAKDPNQAHRLYELGATDAVPETLEASLQLAEAALVDMGAPMGLVIASVHEKRDEFRKLLQAPDRPRRAIRLSTRVKDIGRKDGGG